MSLGKPGLDVDGRAGRLFWIFIWAVIGFTPLFWCVEDALAERLPAGLVYLRDVDPSIQQDIRYAGNYNFMGRPAAGYEAPECILTEEAALGLKRAQASISSLGYSFRVYDCYRPARATREFVDWARNPGDSKMKHVFYPDIDKSRLHTLGYLAKQSSHSKGNTVDLTIVRVGSPGSDANADANKPCYRVGDRRAGKDPDFGTDYDCFHPASHANAPLVSAAAQRNRRWLTQLMSSAGFKGYSREWWHFEMLSVASARSYDFVIVQRVKAPSIDADSEESRGEELASSCGSRAGKKSASTIVCTGSSGETQYYSNPDIRSTPLGRLQQDASANCLRCLNSGLRLDEYWALDSIERKSTGSPWCLIEFSGNAASRLRGWIEGRHLAPITVSVICDP